MFHELLVLITVLGAAIILGNVMNDILLVLKGPSGAVKVIFSKMMSISLGLNCTDKCLTLFSIASISD